MLQQVEPAPMVFPDLAAHDSMAQPAAPLTVTASPMTITATRRCAIHVSGALSAITFARGGWSDSLPVANRIYELNCGDKLTITYLVAPTLTFLPR